MLDRELQLFLGTEAELDVPVRPVARWPVRFAQADDSGEVVTEVLAEVQPSGWGDAVPTLLSKPRR